MTRNEYVVDMPADGSSRPDEHSVATLDRQQQQDTSNSISDSGFIHLSSTAKSSEALITTTEAPAPLTWYFQEDQDKSSAEEYIFKCITEQSPPVKITANNRFTRWTGDTTQFVGVYNVVLGISLKNLDLDSIECIAFSSGRGNPYNYGPLEVLSRQTLLSLGPNTGVVRLGLHEQHVEPNYCAEILVVDMEIRAAVGKALKPELGFIELYYMEFHTAQLSSDSDHSLRVHRPYLWSIDVAHTEESVDNRIYNKSTRIMHYAMSGDGTHVATLSTMDTKLYLDVWDLESESSVHIDPPQNDTPQPPHHPPRCAHKQLHLERDIVPSLALPALIVSISWDASKIAVMSISSRDLKDTFQLFAHNAELRLLSGTQPVSSPTHSLTPLEVNQICKQLKGYTGSGKFLIIASENQDPKDELFVTCDGISVDVYSIRDTWHHIRKIQLVDEVFRENIQSTWGSRRLIDEMRGRYFAWKDNKGAVTVCNLETGLFVSRIPNGQNACFSSDGSMVTIRHSDATITTRWIETNLCISTRDETHRSPAFIQGDSRVLMPLVEPDETYGRGQLGVILDTMSMDVVSRVSVPLSTYGRQQIVTSADGNNIYSLRGSKLSLVRFDDTILWPYAQTRGRCDEQSLCDLEIVGAMAGSAMDKEAVVTMSSGLTFTAGFEAIRKGYMADGVEHRPLIVSVSDGRAQVQEAFRVPAAPMGDILNDWLAYKVTFNIERQEMIVYNNLFFMVWGLPKALDGSFTLLLNWWIQHLPFQITNSVQWLWSGLSRCPHQRYYAFLEDLDEQYTYIMMDAVQLDTDSPFGCNYISQSLDGVLVLIEIFGSGDKQFKDAILQYVGRHLNSYPNPDNLMDSILGRICQKVNQENYSRYTEFLRALFDSRHGNWVPRKDYNHKTNPIWMLLTLAETFPRAMNPARVLIDYCVHKANKEKNWHFASPVLGPLHVLVHRKNIYAQIVHDTLRNLAFIPAMDRSYIIDHHIIAHPPELRWSFWLSNQTPLHKCKDPILQLDYKIKPTKHNLQTDNFTRDMFVASFDLLWLEPESPASVKGMNDQPSHSWISTILHAIWLNCKIKSKTTVKCHDFTLEQLDNPAIAALVEYKWNTIGFAYWMVRFSWQCFYYLLVLVAVFLQVYSEHQRLLVGVFIAIVVFSVIFLWLELLQLVHNWRSYLRSPYNYTDIIAFVLPLTGSINQLYNISNNERDGNVYVLSFAVLFVFIHVLFELRINKAVCHFVTIIIRIMSEIRVFFVVFAAGIIAFTIAILHLLHACPVGLCERETSFPVHFFGAFSSTYFFMGGRYEPVEQEFDGENWPFHMMMIVYFFFTAILLLNVLIALINVAFAVGDETWTLVWIENRLSYVVSAENMSHHIPGFRKNHSYFPKEIYYTATIQQVKKYIGDDGGDLDISQKLFGQGSSAKAVVSTVAKGASVEYENTKYQEGTKKQQEELIEGLRKELAHSRTQLGTLKIEFAERQLTLETQIKALQAANTAEFKEMKDLLSAALTSRA